MDVVLLHGTAQGPLGWKLLADELVRRGDAVHTPELPTGRPEWLPRDYARFVRDALASAIERPVVVAHSGAGLLLPAVALALRARLQVWIAAAVPDWTRGRSFVDEAAGDPTMFNPEWVGIDPTRSPERPAELLFQDCDGATLRWALTTLRLFYPEATYRAPPDAPEREIPSLYLLPREDRTLTPSWMRRAAHERLGVEPVELPGGHCPHVSRPRAVADAVAAATRP